MDHLHHGAQPDAAAAAIAQRTSRQQQQRRADAFAAALAQIAGDFGDGLDGRVRIARELPLYSAEVIPQQLEDLFRCTLPPVCSRSRALPMKVVYLVKCKKPQLCDKSVSSSGSW